MCVGGAFIVAVGLCSLFGVPYGPVHTSLPFMLMGLGVDDIFVMMASWDQVLDYEPNRSKPLTERVAMMLSHAGAAITVTSFTDVVAFIIGASTVRLLFYVIRKLSTLLSKNTVIIRNLFYSDIELISAAFLLENNAYLKKKKWKCKLFNVLSIAGHYFSLFLRQKTNFTAKELLIFGY